MTEAAHPGEDARASGNGDSVPPAEAEQTSAGSEAEKDKPDSGTETSKPDSGSEAGKPDAEESKPGAVGQALSLAEAFKKFKEGGLTTQTGLKVSIPDAVKRWVNGKFVESNLELSLSYKNDGDRLITLEANLSGVYTYKDPGEPSKYIYAPPQLNVAKVIADLVKVDEKAEMRTLFNSVLGFDLTLRKIELNFHEFTTKNEKKEIVEKGFYMSLAVFTDIKPEPISTSDDNTVLSAPNDSTQYFIKDPTAPPKVDKNPFCIFGFGEDRLNQPDNVKWAHFALSLRSMLQANPEFQKGLKADDDNQGDSWAISLPLVSSLLPGSGRLVFGDPFVCFSQNLHVAPTPYLKPAVKFLEEVDPKKTDTKKFVKEDYIRPIGGKARVGVDLKIYETKIALQIEYPSVNNVESAKPSESGETASPANNNDKPEVSSAKPDDTSAKPGKDDAKPDKNEGKSKEGLQKYGSILNPGLVRVGPFTMYKMGFGLETIEQTDPSNKAIKSKRLCLIMRPGIRIGPTPQKGKSHGYIDITDFRITVPVGGEQETLGVNQPPPRLISPVQFSFDGMAIEFSKEDTFLLRGAAYIDHSSKNIKATGEVLFRLGSAKDPKLLIIILMGFWLDLPEKRWGFYIYGMGVFRVTKVPLDPVFTQTYLTGIAIGVGINYLMTIPDINDIEEFPLIKALFGTDVTKKPESPEKAIKSMEGYIKPKSGNHWIAFGLEISTLETIRGFVLVIGIIGSMDVDVTWEAYLLAVLVVTDPKSKVYKIEVVFKLIVTSYGLKIEFLITKSSFLLDKKLTLSGSGYIWIFWDGEHKGEVIITIGGYHPDYKKPKYYPSPKAVSLFYERDFGPVNFRLRGAFYFAIAKKVVMFGISLSASAEVKIIWVWKLWANLAVDVLIFWSPFSLKASAGLEVGISAVVKIWFVKVRIEVCLSLLVRFWRPEDSDWGGIFTFKVLAWRVKVRFGAPEEETIKPTPWNDFVSNNLGLDKKIPNPLMLTVINTETTETAGARINGVPWLPTEAERANQRIDYAVAERLSSEPVLKATSAIPFKEWKVADTPVINGVNGQSWNTKFGVVPCFQTNEALKSTLSIACQSPDKFDFIPEINPTEIPYNAWSPQLLFKPDIKAAGIANTLSGASLRPSARLLKTGNKIGPFTTESLIRYTKRFVWPKVMLPAPLPANTIKMVDFKAHINNSNTNSKRNGVLKALRKVQPELYESVRLNNTAEYADKVLLATPVTHTLGY